MPSHRYSSVNYPLNMHISNAFTCLTWRNWPTVVLMLVSGVISMRIGETTVLLSREFAKCICLLPGRRCLVCRDQNQQNQSENGCASSNDAFRIVQENKAPRFLAGQPNSSSSGGDGIFAAGSWLHATRISPNRPRGCKQEVAAKPGSWQLGPLHCSESPSGGSEFWHFGLSESGLLVSQCISILRTRFGVWSV